MNFTKLNQIFLFLAASLILSCQGPLNEVGFSSKKVYC